LKAIGFSDDKIRELKKKLEEKAKEVIKDKTIIKLATFYALLDTITKKVS